MLFALFSLVASLWNAFHRSQDFQWSPSRVLLHGSNPYEAYLSGSESIIMAQLPNYLHIVYLIVLPLAALPFAVAKVIWSALNVGMVLLVTLCLARRADFSRLQIFLLTCAVISSRPFFHGVGNGQQTPMVLLGAMVSLSASNWRGGVGLAVLVAKYSFAPPLLAALYLRRQMRTLLIAGLVSFSALLAFGRLGSVSPTRASLQPFVVSRTATEEGIADIMSICSRIAPIDRSLLPYFVGIGLCVVLTWLSREAFRRVDWIDCLALASLISLMCFKHLHYDYLFLLPVLVCAMRLGGRAGLFLVALVLLFWYPSWFTPALTNGSIWSMVAGFSLLFAAFLVLCRVLNRESCHGRLRVLDSPANVETLVDRRAR